jgi:hypothetical protein
VPVSEVGHHPTGPDERVSQPLTLPNTIWDETRSAMKGGRPWSDRLLNDYLPKIILDGQVPEQHATCLKWSEIIGLKDHLVTDRVRDPHASWT